MCVDGNVRQLLYSGDNLRVCHVCFCCCLPQDCFNTSSAFVTTTSFMSTAWNAYSSISGHDADQHSSQCMRSSHVVAVLTYARSGQASCIIMWCHTRSDTPGSEHVVENQLRIASPKLFSLRCKSQPRVKFQGVLLRLRRQSTRIMPVPLAECTTSNSIVLI